MPVVLPNTPAPSSTPQVVPVVAIYDYLLTDAGAGYPNQRIQVRLNATNATTIAPATEVGPRAAFVTTTDANGYWTVNVVPNTNISPSGSLYVVETPFRSYRITVGPTGPYQSTAGGTYVDG